MSGLLCERVLFTSDIPRKPKLVLMVLAAHARDDGAPETSVSLDDIAQMAGCMSTRGARKWLAWLEDSGHIAPDHPNGRYTLRLDMLAEGEAEA